MTDIDPYLPVARSPRPGPSTAQVPPPTARTRRRWFREPRTWIEIAAVVVLLAVAADARSAENVATRALRDRPAAVEVGAGRHQVGDLAAGRFRTDGAVEGCSYRLLPTTSSTGAAPTVEEHDVSGPTTVEMDAGWFETRGDCTWVRVV